VPADTDESATRRRDQSGGDDSADSAFHF
jgi:hypothetical protein